MDYGFSERLMFSQGVVAATCLETIKNHIPGCVSVEKASLAMDKNGIDYIVKLGGGATIRIDHKARGACSRWWRNGPELALELWSVKPVPPRLGKIGWTLDESKETDYTLHTFEDAPQCFFLPFQLLRWAFKKNGPSWITKYKRSTQNTDGRYDSECLFVPSVIVLDAIMKEMNAARLMGK